MSQVDELSRLIQEKAAVLYRKLADVQVKELGLPPLPEKYYNQHHNHRLFFSIQTAAELLYRSIKLKGKPVQELILMDYGGGMGSLFLLAGMIGCRKVIYNDILEDMTAAARILCSYLGVPVNVFIAGDYTATIAELNKQGIQCDIILSRNVIEHIYDLDRFYAEMAAGQPQALIYFSTTANFQNPAMLWYHKRLHARAERDHNRPKREAIIRKALPALEGAMLEKLALATRGLAAGDLERAIENYRQNGILPDPDMHYTNSCDPENGLWYEHIIPVRDYRQIIESKGYRLTVLPAFWDTHYKSALKNAFGKAMNFLTRLLGPRNGLKVTAFIYIIAEKKP